MVIQLDGRLMNSRSTAHDYLKQQLHLPEYYGRNLDALFDLLTQIGSHTAIALTHQEVMFEMLGSYGEILIETLEQAADENPYLTFSAQ